MSEKTLKIPIKGKLVEGVDVKFNVVNEDWNVYKLEDGAQIKVKVVPTKIVRAKSEYNQLGEPIYHVSHQSILVAEDIPDKLMKKG